MTKQRNPTRVTVEPKPLRVRLTTTGIKQTRVNARPETLVRVRGYSATTYIPNVTSMITATAPADTSIQRNNGHVSISASISRIGRVASA